MIAAHGSTESAANESSCMLTSGHFEADDSTPETGPVQVSERSERYSMRCDVVSNMRCRSYNEIELKERPGIESDERGRTMALPTHLVERIPKSTAEQLDDYIRRSST